MGSSGSVLRGILALSLPMTVANLVQQSYLIADSVIVGRYVGVAGLAAVGAAQPVYFLVNSVFLGLLNGFTIRLANLTGRGDLRTRDQTALALGGFVLLWSLGCVLVVVFGAGPLLAAVGIAGPTAAGGQSYLDTLAFGVAPIFGLGALTAFFRGLGNTRSIMAVLAASSLLNIVLAWLFVGGLGMGVRGAALGTVCASALSCTAGLILAGRRHTIHAYRAPVSACRRQLGRALRLGLPMGVQFVFLAVGNLVLISLVAPFGAAAIAAMSVAGRLETVTGRVFLDISGAVTVFVARGTGAGDILGARRAVRVSLASGLVLTIAVTAAVLLGRAPVAHLFTGDTAVVDILNTYILITYPFFGFYTLMAVAHGFLNGLGRTTLPLVCTIVSFVVARVPAAAVLRGPLGLPGIMWAVDIGWIVGAAFTAWAVHRHLRRLAGTGAGAPHAQRQEGRHGEHDGADRLDDECRRDQCEVERLGDPEKPDGQR